MRINQTGLEALFSQRNIHDVLHQSIKYQFEHKLLTWALRAHLRVNAYIEQTYYTSKGDLFTSKNERIALLRDSIQDKGLTPLVIALTAAVIRSKKNQTIQQVIGYLQTYLPHDDHFDRARTAGELLAVCGGHNSLYYIDRPVDNEAPMIVVTCWSGLKQLFEAEFDHISDTFYNPPLISKPKEVTSRHNCGYHTIEEPVLLGRNTQHNHKIDLTAINILNEIPWVLDQQVLAEQECPPKALNRDAACNFAQQTLQSQRIYDILDDAPFYLAWQYDSRGRLYSHGYHVNLQSYEYKKALLNIDHYEVATT